jgi:hypothetical protein
MIRKNTRTCWGPFPVWQDRWIVGRSWMNLLHRKSMRLNMNVEVYSRGKYPYMFREKDLLEAVTTRIPLPVLKELAADLGYELQPIPGKSIRIQKTNDHKWQRKRFGGKA